MCISFFVLMNIFFCIVKEEERGECIISSNYKKIIEVNMSRHHMLKKINYFKLFNGIHKNNILKIENIHFEK